MHIAKKIISAFMASVICVSLVGCGGNSDSENYQSERELAEKERQDWVPLAASFAHFLKNVKYNELVNDINSNNVDNILEVKDMNLWYSNFHALKNINMEIPENQITAFIGPSGCGKSTFLKSLNRMNDLVDGVKITGSIIYDNQNILDANIDVNQLENIVDLATNIAEWVEFSITGMHGE